MNLAWDAVNDNPQVISPVKLYTDEDIPLFLNKPYPLTIRDVDIAADDNTYIYQVTLDHNSYVILN